LRRYEDEMDHLINCPIEIEENEDDYVQPSKVTLQCMYHKGFEKNHKVNVFIYNTKFRGVIVDSVYYGGCYLLSINVVESFKLRMIEQIIHIEASGLSADEWVSKYGDSFPEE
jgi:hypothetical protein